MEDGFLLMVAVLSILLPLLVFVSKLGTPLSPVLLFAIFLAGGNAGAIIRELKRKK